MVPSSVYFHFIRAKVSHYDWMHWISCAIRISFSSCIYFYFFKPLKKWFAHILKICHSINSSDIDAEGSSQQRHRREIPKVLVEPPHLCTKKIDENGKDIIDRCHVYTESLDSLTVRATLHGATNQENDTHSAEWCNYPLGESRSLNNK